MVKVLYGKKGLGKTKVLVETANKISETAHGSIVFIDDDNDLIYDLDRKVRFIDVSEFKINNLTLFQGFLCGMISQNYDIENVFIDGLSYIVKQLVADMESFFVFLSDFSEKYNTNFYISINGEEASMPEYIKRYHVDINKVKLI